MKYAVSDKWRNLPSSGFFIRHVKDIGLFDVTLRSLTADPRVPVIADDVDYLHISDLRADRLGARAVQLIDVRTFKQK